ncbi:MAG: HlyC/CorC family transporter [Candidatus Heimdallarchaeota archaeon]|nr:HlyC/CorC family transporter [Candidatus Heimdallarchaeota archaeon]
MALNGFFVASEFAFVRLRKSRIQELVQSGSNIAKKMESITNNLDRSMSSTQLGITLASIALGFVGEEFFIELISGILEGLTVELDPYRIALIAFFIGYFIISYLHVVLGELVPKSYAIQFAEKTAMICAYPLDYFMKITNPILNFFVWTSNSILKLMKIPIMSETHSQAYSEEEIKIIIQDSIKHGELEAYESSLIYNILDFTDKPAKTIITPRYKLSAVKMGATIGEIINLSKETGFSRFPVYEDKIDDIKGFIHIKDAINSLGEDINMLDAPFNFDDYLREVIIAHESKPIDDLLKEMQRKQTQVSILVNEWGTLEGIITIEDIVEAIVGPILDEFDDSASTKWITTTKEGKYMIDAQIPIDEFNEFFEKLNSNVQIEAKESITLAGFLLEFLESEIPELGDEISINHCKFNIVEVDGYRIDTVELRIQEPEIENIEDPDTLE